ncbi:MAG: virulence factor [Parcubacteria group bacterium Athens1014_10]|nr:MAG: virulence factor [Parcubacteria group bacterium Athens1014_10]TSD04670.1 MAG: virulence factor [Parcubacteria group bacterium Athens0714_12]
MIKKISAKLSGSIAGGAMIIAFFSVCSRFLGLLRDHLLAGKFGAGEVLDTYYAAFRLPDLIFNTLVLGALSAAFIPVFLEHWVKNKDEAWKITNSFLNLLFLTLFIFSVIFFIFTPQLVATIIAPGFDLERKKLTVDLTRVMLFSILFFSVSNVVSSVLNSFKKFFAYSLAPVVYNLGIIIGILFLVPRYGNAGLALGVVLGAFLHLIVQIPTLLKLGFKWQPILNFSPAVKKIGFLMLPRVFALAANQISKLVTTVIASTLTVGSIAVYNLADNLQSFPIGIFGISLAISAFPYFSESVSNGDLKKFSDHFSITFRRILFLIIPSSVLILLLRAQITRLVLGSGLFSWRDTILTLDTLGYFSLSIFAQALIPLLTRAFYAFQNTKTPVLISIFSLIVNIFLAVILGNRIGVAGLALAFSIATIINFILLFSILKFKVHFLKGRKFIFSLAKITIASSIMALIVQAAKSLAGAMVNMDTFSGVLIQTLISILIGVFSFLILAFLLRCGEAPHLSYKKIMLGRNKVEGDSAAKTNKLT